MDEFRKLLPRVGSYVWETDFFQPNWQDAFWGENYARLRAVKDKYDPAVSSSSTMASAARLERGWICKACRELANNARGPSRSRSRTAMGLGPNGGCFNFRPAGPSTISCISSWASPSASMDCGRVCFRTMALWRGGGRYGRSWRPVSARWWCFLPSQP